MYVDKCNTFWETFHCGKVMRSGNFKEQKILKTDLKNKYWVRTL